LPLPHYQNVEVIKKLILSKTMNLKIFIPRTHENTKTRNPIQQENIDFNTLFRYKKASTEKEEAC
jgi:hypothetical protein